MQIMAVERQTITLSKHEAGNQTQNPSRKGKSEEQPMVWDRVSVATNDSTTNRIDISSLDMLVSSEMKDKFCKCIQSLGK